MFQNKTKNSRATLIMLACVPMCLTLVRAEGGDKRPGYDYGVNRRVISKVPDAANDLPGTTELRGTFSGLTGVATFRLPVDTDGTVTSLSNPFDDKPTAYFGGNLNGVEVDAGLQYEWREVRIVDQAGKLTGRVPPGYMPYISVSGFYTSPKTKRALDGNAGNTDWFPWRGGDADDYSIHYKVWNGTQEFKLNANSATTPVRGAVSVTLTGDFNGTFFWSKTERGLGSATPPQPFKKPPLKHDPAENLRAPTPDSEHWVFAKAGIEDKSPPANVTIWPYRATKPLENRAFPLDNNPNGNITKLRGKRVIGITQSGKFEGETDGSYFECAFSNGWINFSNKPPNEVNTQTNGRPWQPSDVDNTGSARATGYDTPGNLPDGQDKAGKQDSNPPAMDRTWFGTITPGARYKTEFPVMGKAARKAGSDSENLKEDGKNRYAQETVRVNLQNATRPWGYRVEPSEATP